MSILDTIYNALSNRGRQIKQAVNSIANSPEVRFISNPQVAENLAMMNADNHLWEAYTNVMNQFIDARSPRIKNVDDAIAAGRTYKDLYDEFWQYTTGWPSWNWENLATRMQAYNSYWRRDNGRDLRRWDWWLNWEKWAAIEEWQKFVPYNISNYVKSGANLLREMDILVKGIKELERQEAMAYKLVGAADDRDYERLQKEYLKSNQKTRAARDLLAEKRAEYYNLINNYRNGA